MLMIDLWNFEAEGQQFGVLWSNIVDHTFH